MSRRAITAAAVALAAAALWLGPGPAPASGATHSTWADASGNWSNAANWSPQAPPNGSADTAWITHDIAADATVTIDAGMPSGVTVLNLFLEDDSHDYTLASAGGSLTLKGLVQADGPGRCHVISAPFVLGLPVTVMAETADLEISGPVGGAGALGELIKDGPGSVFLTGANAYEGETTVAAGTLAVRTPGALGSAARGTTVVAGATLALDLAAGVTVTGEAVALKGSGVAGQGALRSAAGASVWNGPVTIADAAAIGVDGGSLLTLGDLRVGGALTKVGTGELVIGGTQDPGPGAALLATTGSVRLDSDAGGAAGGCRLAVTVMAHARVRFGATQHLAELNVLVGEAALVAGAGAVVTPSLLVASHDSVLDLADGALVVDYEPGSSPIDDVAGWVRSGFHSGGGGYWDGNGIVSSRAAAEGLTAVGVLDNADPKVGGKTEFAGESVDATAVLARYTWWGDANLDGVIDANDYDVIDKNYLFTPNPAAPWFTGDFTYDGVIDANDYDRIDKAYLFQTGPLGASDPAAPMPSPIAAPALGSGAGPDAMPSPAPVPTPEPATLALVAIGAAALAGRRSRARRRV